MKRPPERDTVLREAYQQKRAHKAVADEARRTEALARARRGGQTRKEIAAFVHVEGETLTRWLTEARMCLRTQDETPCGKCAVCKAKGTKSIIQGGGAT